MKWRLLLCMLLLTTLLTGCVGDIESYLQPPRTGGTQAAVQDALETALRQEDAVAQYTLKYPAEGTASAFLLLDGAGNPAASDDEAVTAIAFYALTAGENTHVHLLHKGDAGWVSVADKVGQGQDIHRVQLGDLDGDGLMELTVGWDLYSSDYQLSVYSLRESLQETADGGRYTQYAITDLDADGKEELLLLRIGAQRTVVASLCDWAENKVTVRQTVGLPRNILSFTNILPGKLSDGTAALYVDGALETGAWVTELIYWNGKELVAPLQNVDADGVFSVTRQAAVPAMDIDGNGVPEIPVTSRLAAYPEAKGADTWRWLTEWYSWDIVTGAASRRSGSIVNGEDGYLIELDEEWLLQIAVTYDEETHTLSLFVSDGEEPAEPFLVIQDIAAYQGEEPTEDYAFEQLPGNKNMYVWYDGESDFRLTMEKISYMLIEF